MESLHVISMFIDNHATSHASELTDGPEFKYRSNIIFSPSQPIQFHQPTEPLFEPHNLGTYEPPRIASKVMVQFIQTTV